MRYPADHKARSRARILESARQLFREEGLDGASIDTVMKHAGLTRGAFYAHFSSREDLVQQVLALEPGLVAEARAAPVEALTSYLSPERRTEVLANCAFVAHQADVRRGNLPRREAMQAHVEAMWSALSAERSEAALQALILTLGAASLSGAVADSALADRIEAAAAKAVEELLR